MNLPAVGGEIIGLGSGVGLCYVLDSKTWLMMFCPHRFGYVGHLTCLPNNGVDKILLDDSVDLEAA